MRRLALLSATIAVFALLSCSVTPQGSLDPGGKPGTGVMVTGVRRTSDGRDVALSMSVLTNNSSTHEVVLKEAALIDSAGLRLVDAFTVSMDAQVGVGMPVPPRPTDGDDPEAARLEIENWAARVPLAQSVVPPGGVLQLVLVVHPESADDCLSMKGFSLRYEEHGDTYAVDANLAAYLYTQGANDSGDEGHCQDVVNHFMDHPLT